MKSIVNRISEVLDKYSFGVPDNIKSNFIYDIYKESIAYYKESSLEKPSDTITVKKVGFGFIANNSDPNCDKEMYTHVCKFDSFEGDSSYDWFAAFNSAGKLVAMCCFGKGTDDKGAKHLYCISTNSKFAGHRYSQRMLQCLEDLYFDEGYDTIRLMPDISNFDHLSEMYTKWGYKFEDIKKEYMKKTITSKNGKEEQIGQFMWKFKN